MSANATVWWKTGWVPFVAALIATGFLFVPHYIERNREAENNVNKGAAVCFELNEMVFGDFHAFVSKDLADRRRSIVMGLIGSGGTFDEFEREMRITLKDAKRLNVEPWKLAELAHFVGDLPLAEKAAREVLAGPDKASPGDHVTLGDILCSAKRYGEAEAEYRKALEVAAASFDTRWFDPAQRIARLFSDETTYAPVGDGARRNPTVEAEILRRKELSLGFWQTRIVNREKSLTDGKWRKTVARTAFANTLVHVANVLRDCGRFKEAREHYGRALEYSNSGDAVLDGVSQEEFAKRVQQSIDALPSAEGSR